MPSKRSSQKSLSNKPRVQIEYEVFTDGAEKKVQLPFVVGVMADLTGNRAKPLDPLSKRKFLEIDHDNFDQRFRACKPRVAFQVPNTLTGEGNMNVDITFESMDDFSPDRVAQKVDALSKLLQARTELDNLKTYMGGKDEAEELITKMLGDASLLKALASSPKPTVEPPK